MTNRIRASSTHSNIIVKFSSQSGIAIGPIIFIVAILAILGAAIAASEGWLTGGTSNENARAMAEAIIAQQDLIVQATQRLIVENSCSPTQISFSNPISTAANGGTDPYANSNAPANGSCNVFGPSGGGIQYTPPPPSALDKTHAGQYFYGQDYFFGFANVKNLGTSSSADLIMTIPYIQSSVATEINAILGIGAVSNDLIGSLYYGTGITFTGAYNYYGGSYGTNATNVWGQMAGCVYRYDLGGPTPYPTQDDECYRVLIVQ